MLVAISSTPHFSAQSIVRSKPLVAFTPATKVVINALPLREITRQHSPLNATDDNIQNSIDDGTHLHLARASTMFSFGEQLKDHAPIGCQLDQKDTFG